MRVVVTVRSESTPEAAVALLSCPTCATPLAGVVPVLLRYRIDMVQNNFPFTRGNRTDGNEGNEGSCSNSLRDLRDLLFKINSGSCFETDPYSRVFNTAIRSNLSNRLRTTSPDRIAATTITPQANPCVEGLITSGMQ